MTQTRNRCIQTLLTLFVLLAGNALAETDSEKWITIESKQFERNVEATMHGSPDPSRAISFKREFVKYDISEPPPQQSSELDSSYAAAPYLDLGKRLTKNQAQLEQKYLKKDKYKASGTLYLATHKTEDKYTYSVKGTASHRIASDLVHYIIELSPKHHSKQKTYKAAFEIYRIEGDKAIYPVLIPEGTANK